MIGTRFVSSMENGQVNSCRWVSMAKTCKSRPSKVCRMIPSRNWNIWSDWQVGSVYEVAGLSVWHSGTSKISLLIIMTKSGIGYECDGTSLFYAKYRSVITCPINRRHDQRDEDSRNSWEYPSVHCKFALVKRQADRCNQKYFLWW